MSADGSIVIEVDLDTSNAERDYAKLRSEAKKLRSEITAQEMKKAPLVEQAEQLSRRLKEARADAARFGEQWRNGVAGADQSQSKALETVRQLETEYVSVVKQIDKIDEKLLPNVASLEKMQQNAGEFRRELDTSGKANAKKTVEAINKQAERLNTNMKKAAATTRRELPSALVVLEKRFERFGQRIKSTLASAFIFSVIYASLSELKDWFAAVVKTNEEATTAIANLKGALLALVQPIVDVVLPALTSFINLLARLAASAARVVSSLFGVSVKQSAESAENLYKEQEALDGVGEAAKKASKPLANFDEINRLSAPKAAEGDGTQTSAGEGIAPNFDFAVSSDFTWIDNVKEKFASLFDTISNSTAMQFLREEFDKAKESFSGFAENFSEKIPDIKENLGSIGESVSRIFPNISEILGNVFSPLLETIGTEVMPRLGEFSGEFSGVVTKAFAEVFSFANKVLDAIKPAAAILGNILGGIFDGLVKAWDEHGEPIFDGINTAIDETAAFLNKIWDEWILPVWNNFMETVDKVWNEHLKPLWDKVSSFVLHLAEEALNIYNKFIMPILNWLSKVLKPLWDFWWDKIFSVVETFFAAADAIISPLIDALDGLIDFISGVFTLDFEKAWNGIKEFLRGLVNVVIGFFESLVNFFVEALNLLTGAVSLVSGAIGDLIGVDLRIPEIGKVSFGRIGEEKAPAATPQNESTRAAKARDIVVKDLPRMATGGVIPPNREFLAVLGDQRSGTNIEAPLDTIVQAMQIALGNGNGGKNEAILELDGDILGRVMYKLYNRENNRIGVSLAGGLA